MTKFFAEAVAAVSRLPEAQQDEVARVMLHMIAPDADNEEIDPAHLDGVLQGLADIRAGRIATEAEVEEAYRQFGA